MKAVQHAVLKSIIVNLNVFCPWIAKQMVTLKFKICI